jgi:predicted AlkP superfamily phosphohydrolase/phosphomutase
MVAPTSFPIYYSLSSPYSTLYNPDIEKASLKEVKRDIDNTEGKKQVNNQPNKKKTNIVASHLDTKSC